MGFHTHFNSLATAVLEAQTVGNEPWDRFKELKLC